VASGQKDSILKVLGNTMKYPFSISVWLSFILLLNCAAHTNLEPTGKGKFSANFSIGGPIVTVFGTKMPVPYATAGGSYGLNNKYDLNGNLHLLPLSYNIFGFDFSSTWYPVINNGKIPTIGIQPCFLTFISLKSHINERFKMYPIVSGSAAWNVKRGLIYTGTNIAMPLSLSDYDEDASHTILSPFVGYRWTTGRRTYIATEIKWHGANIRTDQLAVECIHLRNHGALSILFSIQRIF
jgi:hypothetical protein